MSFVTLVPEGRGTAGGGRNGPPSKRMEPQEGPPTHVSGSQEGVKGQWRAEGPGGCGVVGGCLVRDAQGLRWNSGYGVQGTMEVRGVKLVGTQWALRCQESQDAHLLLIWASGRCGGNTEMGMVERTGFEGAMKGLALNFSRGRRLQDPERERSGGQGWPLQLSSVWPGH